MKVEEGLFGRKGTSRRGTREDNGGVEYDQNTYIYLKSS
jgi:hypothetical protein